MLSNDKIRIRAYHLGQGECFLVQFNDRKKRSILIDFGAPSSHPLSELSAVAKDVAEQSNGKLDAVVITHDHADRISGFLSTHEVFNESIEVDEVWINAVCDIDEEDELSESLHACRNLVSPFRKVLSESKAKVEQDFKYRLENNSDVQSHLEYICGMVKENRIRHLERTDQPPRLRFSSNVGLNVHSPLEGIGNYDDDYRQNQISSIHTRLKTRLEHNPDEGDYLHPMFGDSYNRTLKPSHISDSDFRTLRRKNFILGTSEYGLVEKAIDNSALIFTLEINGKKLLFAGDITEANWYWMNFCLECCELEDPDPECPKCEQLKNQWANLDFCKVTSHVLDYEHENEILNLISPESQLLLTKHPNGETNKLIQKSKKKHGSNLTVINSTSNQLWSDIYV